MIDQTYIDPWRRRVLAAGSPVKTRPRSSTPSSPTPASPRRGASIPTDGRSDRRVDPAILLMFEYQTKDRPRIQDRRLPAYRLRLLEADGAHGRRTGSVFYFAYKDAKSGAGFYRLTDASVVKDPTSGPTLHRRLRRARPRLLLLRYHRRKEPQNNPSAASLLTPR